MGDFRKWLAPWAACVYVMGRKCFPLHMACAEVRAWHCTGAGRIHLLPSSRMNFYPSRYWSLVKGAGGLWILTKGFPSVCVHLFTAEGVTKSAGEPVHLGWLCLIPVGGSEESKGQWYSDVPFCRGKFALLWAGG